MYYNYEGQLWVQIQGESCYGEYPEVVLLVYVDISVGEPVCL